jgi:hypothetical protein
MVSPVIHGISGFTWDLRFYMVSPVLHGISGYTWYLRFFSCVFFYPPRNLRYLSSVYVSLRVYNYRLLYFYFCTYFQTNDKRGIKPLVRIGAEPIGGKGVKLFVELLSGKSFEANVIRSHSSPTHKPLQVNYPHEEYLLHILSNYL